MKTVEGGACLKKALCTLTSDGPVCSPRSARAGVKRLELRAMGRIRLLILPLVKVKAPCIVLRWRVVILLPMGIA